MYRTNNVYDLRSFKRQPQVGAPTCGVKKLSRPRLGTNSVMMQLLRAGKINTNRDDSPAIEKLSQ